MYENIEFEKAYCTSNKNGTIEIEGICRNGT